MKTTRDTVTEVPANQEKNVHMQHNPAAQRDFDYMTEKNQDERDEGSDVETVLGSVHITMPTFKKAFFLLRPFLHPLLEQLATFNARLERLIELQELTLINLDKPYALSQNVGYQVDYKQRRYLSALTYQTGVTLVVNGVTSALTPGNWTPINFPIGTVIYAQGVSDGSPVTIIVRASMFS